MNNSYRVPVLLVLALAGGGCVGRPGIGGFSRPDLRRTIAVSDPEPRLIVVGPARVLHLDIERSGAVTVFRVPRRDGTAADCINAPTQTVTAKIPARGAFSIAKDESVCASVARRATLSWHVQQSSVSLALPARQEHASLP